MPTAGNNLDPSQLRDQDIDTLIREVHRLRRLQRQARGPAGGEVQMHGASVFEVHKRDVDHVVRHRGTCLHQVLEHRLKTFCRGVFVVRSQHPSPPIASSQHGIENITGGIFLCSQYFLRRQLVISRPTRPRLH